MVYTVYRAWQSGNYPPLRIPAYCAVCGNLFPAPIQVGGTATVEIGDSRIECPKCESIARLLPGVFEVLDELIVLVQGPDFSRRALDAMQNAAASTSLMQLEERLVALEQTHEKAGGAFRRWIREFGFPFATLLATVAVPLWIHYDSKANSDPHEITITVFNEELSARATLPPNELGRGGNGPVHVERLAVPIPREDRRADPGTYRDPEAKNRKERRAEAAKLRIQKPNRPK